MLVAGCKKEDPTPPKPTVFSLNSLKVNGTNQGFNYDNFNLNPVIDLSFSAKIDPASVPKGIQLSHSSGSSIPLKVVYQSNATDLTVQPESPLVALERYTLLISPDLKSTAGGTFQVPITVKLRTGLDSTAKFPTISDDSLLTLVQRKTFGYFWEFGHPVSGLARERNTSGDVVTSGGSGFGIMAIPVAVHRNFITRSQGLERIQKIVNFLGTKAQRFHGAFPHWLHGSTGEVVPFSPKDNGADLVETSFLMQGLLAARQYFNGNDPAEKALRDDINALWKAVEWDWFRQNGQNVLYWHWSPDYGWEINQKISGWNESLITYVLAAASPTHTIPKVVYDEGWTRNGGFRNGNTYQGITLPLGPDYGGPLFLAHYSFLGLNPRQLKDGYTDYFTQNRNHTLINYRYCKENPKHFYGYSGRCWGLTASDIPDGYTASSPTNDRGVIAPTAALASFPYTPDESMEALKFYYYVLGDKIWGEYGFHDAFSLDQPWFATSYLAIDQGPIILMIENQRSGLVWDLLMSCPEVKSGLSKLGLQ
ncbi:glucoamylase family protein [Salmonirosea aquatica]|uniref:Beta-glucosidase n=1 Tax=Salmonirosea aquatica TaxID=2654236 RepID=A0A7C9FQU9_9BACT|nr:beta-glucosidase [Cytophagaceae bacterium SJW1-29]